MTPTIGRVVVYKISEYDAAEINQRRDDAEAFRRSLPDHPVPAGERGRTGHVEHVGNKVYEGDEFPATVVRTVGVVGTGVNLQVTLDGNDAYWATSRAEGGDPGSWHWPERVG
jgi:hypothetical protein